MVKVQYISKGLIIYTKKLKTLKNYLTHFFVSVYLDDWLAAKFTSLTPNFPVVANALLHCTNPNVRPMHTICYNRF